MLNRDPFVRARVRVEFFWTLAALLILPNFGATSQISTKYFSI